MTYSGNKTTFFSAAFSLISIFAASATPIPLYRQYQQIDSVSYYELSLSSVVYFVGAVTALVVFGRLSDHFGRRNISVISLLLSVAAMLSLLQVHSAAPLLMGRLLQGLSCGLASTALAAWVVDCARSVPGWLVPAVVSCGPMTGLTAGGIVSGILVEYGPLPRQMPFFLVLLLLIICIAALGKAHETVEKKPGALVSLIPRFALPHDAKVAFPRAAVTFVCTWALGGFFQAFGPAMASEQLNSSNAVAAAMVFASIMAPAAIGALIAGKMNALAAQRAGMLSFALFVLILLFTLRVHALNAFLLASILAGIAQGVVLTGSIRTMVDKVDLADRASVLSVIYATSYTGAAVPTLIAGYFSSVLGLFWVATGYGALALMGALLILVLKPKTGDDLYDR
ncbi:MFS transporter [Pectobacterium brasiliense]|uniref:MFS transporter n=1 Tax=Pectobacterium brasiliense TaxID=180957 RepID=A0AAW9GZ94_9GAMM|nr:MFS transporter [Pectobacterium brasiliense]MDY4376825.1 MFS transporter [Pectobacterium brasiliense]